MQSATLQHTPLLAAHQRHGGKIVPFAGWELPVKYTEVIAEHNTVRTAAGLFDVSHMGELTVVGKDALNFLQYLTCNDVSKVTPGKAQYSAFLNEQGGVIDDIIIYCNSTENYLICVNASNTEQDFAWCKKHCPKFVIEVLNKSKDFAQIAIQGPQAVACLQTTLDSSKASTKIDLSSINTFHFAHCDSAFGPLILARTGYTGEDGFEIFLNPAQADALWEALLKDNQSIGLKPCGLGARDSLRLEACYPLHGHELAENVSALESGLGWIVKFEKGDFIGKEALQKIKAAGLPRKLVGFFVEGSGLVREQTKLFNDKNEEIGIVTSGTLTPTIKKSLGMALVKYDAAQLDQIIYAEVRGRKLDCRIVKMPFYKLKK